MIIESADFPFPNPKTKPIVDENILTSQVTNQILSRISSYSVEKELPFFMPEELNIL